jgi:hypothetical protein
MDIKQHIKDAVRKATGRDVEVVLGTIPEGMDDADLRAMVSSTIERMVKEIKDDTEGKYMGAKIGMPDRDDEPCCTAASVGKIMAMACMVSLEMISEAAEKGDMDAVRRALLMVPIAPMKSLLDKL